MIMELLGGIKSSWCICTSNKSKIKSYTGLVKRISNTDTYNRGL
eukprot:UN13806